jgi:hypothetical protein
MGVTRIRYLLDQWRLRSVAMSIQNRLGEEREAPGWQIPALEAPKPPSEPPRPEPPRSSGP